MAGMVALVRRGEESRGREMKWKQQQHVAWFIYFGIAAYGHHMASACYARSAMTGAKLNRLNRFSDQTGSTDSVKSSTYIS